MFSNTFKVKLFETIFHVGFKQVIDNFAGCADIAPLGAQVQKKQTDRQTQTFRFKESTGLSDLI